LRIIYPANIRFPMERANSIQITSTCHALARAGVTVDLVVRRTGWQSTKECLAFYGLTPHGNLRVRRLPVLNTHWSLGLWNRSYSLGALAWMLGRCRLGGVEAITLRDLGLARILLKYKTLFRVPVVYEAHEISHIIYRDLHTHLADVPELDRAQLSRIEASERFVYAHADTVVSITQALAELIQETFAPAAPITVIPDGAAVRPQQKEERSDSITYIGQLYPWKGVDTLVHAMKLLAGRRLVVVGGLPYESDMERVRKLAEAEGVAERISFEGFVPPSEVARHLARAAVGVIPLPDNLMARCFTSPLKLFEYMAAGVPIVASDLPSIREILRDRENALLVPPGDAEALANAIGELLTDAGLASKLAARARQDVEDYTWDRRARAIMTVLDEVVSRSERD